MGAHAWAFMRAPCAARLMWCSEGAIPGPAEELHSKTSVSGQRCREVHLLLDARLTSGHFRACETQSAAVTVQPRRWQATSGGGGGRGMLSKRTL